MSTRGLVVSAVAIFVSLSTLACGGSDGATASGSTSNGAGGSSAGSTGAVTTSSSPSASGGGSSGAYRPFSPESPWNTPIGDNPAIDPNSAALIDDLASSTASWNFLSINMTDYSIPVYYIDSPTTPLRSVACDYAGTGFPALVPIPDGALPDPESDHHISMVDETVGMEWAMWNAASQADGTWTCGVGAIADLKGTGVRPPVSSNPWVVAAGARASGFPLIAGLIRVEEVQAGKIDHALVIAYPHCRSHWFVPPASTSQGTVSTATPDSGIPMGGRIQLDPSIDVTSLGLTPTNVLIARALQEYGAYVGDFSGAISLYAENGPEARAAWNAGLLDPDNLIAVFDQAALHNLRVLQLPPLLEGVN